MLGRYQLGRPPRGELWSLESADVEREWHEVARDVVAVAHASYAAELVAALLPAEAPDSHALELIVALWEALAGGGPSVGALRALELALLELAGHEPALAAARHVVRRSRRRVFDPARGGAICRRCGATSRARACGRLTRRRSRTCVRSQRSESKVRARATPTPRSGPAIVAPPARR